MNRFHILVRLKVLPQFRGGRDFPDCACRVRLKVIKVWVFNCPELLAA